VFKRRQTQNLTARTRFDRMGQEDLLTSIETSFAETARLYRGLSHREIDQGWLLAELEHHTQAALAAIQALQRKVAE
jgi:hypothetical protein